MFHVFAKLHDRLDFNIISQFPQSISIISPSYSTLKLNKTHKQLN